MWHFWLQQPRPRRVSTRVIKAGVDQHPRNPKPTVDQAIAGLAEFHRKIRMGESFCSGKTKAFKLQEARGRKPWCLVEPELPRTVAACSRPQVLEKLDGKMQPWSVNVSRVGSRLLQVDVESPEPSIPAQAEGRGQQPGQSSAH